MNEDRLQALAEGQLMGTAFYQPRQDRLRFTYAPSWRESRHAYPLSLSMPLSAGEFGDEPTRAFLTGLLPDNAGVLQQWTERFHVSPHNVFRLLQHVGEDCAGAVQFVIPARAAELLAKPGTHGGVEWLTEAGLAERLRLLLRDHSATRAGSDRGHFSLAGAQPKTGLYYDLETQRWGVPYGAVPPRISSNPPRATSMVIPKTSTSACAWPRAWACAWGNPPSKRWAA